MTMLLELETIEKVDDCPSMDAIFINPDRITHGSWGSFTLDKEDGVYEFEFITIYTDYGKSYNITGPFWDQLNEMAGIAWSER